MTKFAVYPTRIGCKNFYAMKLRLLSLIVVGALLCDFSVEAKSPKTSEDVVIVDIDTAPEFEGGDDAMFAWINANVRYPESMAGKRKKGVVVVDFLVNTDGTLSNIHLTKKLNKEADTEALRLVHMMPKWQPGMYQGHAVAVPFSLPIGFYPPKEAPEEQETMYSWVKKKLSSKKAGEDYAKKDQQPDSVKVDDGNPVIFVNGQLFSGDINSLNLNDVEEMMAGKPSPEYPNGRIDIKLKTK